MTPLYSIPASSLTPRTLACIAVSLWTLGGCTNRNDSRTRAEETPVGELLPKVQLVKPDGSPMDLGTFLGARPAVIYIFGMAECASCSNLPLEFKIVHKEAPQLVTLLVASGASTDAFRERLHSMGLEREALVDEDRRLLRGLRIMHEPIVILVDSTGRILFADTRGASRAAQYPVGHIIRDLRGIIYPPKPSADASHELSDHSLGR